MNKPILPLILVVSLIAALSGTEQPRMIPGAIVAPAGQVMVIRDTITVRMELDIARVHSDLESIRKLTNTISDHFHTTFKRPDPMSNSSKSRDNMFDLISTKLNTLLLQLSTIERSDMTSTHNSELHHASFRHKRGLMNFMGSLSKSLFGTATEEDITNVHLTIDKMTSKLNKMGKLVLLNSQNSQYLAGSVNLLLDRFSKLHEYSLSQSNHLHELEMFIYYIEQIKSISDHIDMVRHYYNLLTLDIRDAAANKATSNLLPKGKLKTALSVALRNLHLKSIFPSEQLDLYYPLIDTTLGTNAIYAHIPLDPQNRFTGWNIIPFPYTYNNSTITLDVEPTTVIKSDDGQWYSYTSSSDLASCKSAVSKFHVCPAYLFSFYRTAELTCMNQIVTLNSSTLDSCTYKEVNPNKPLHVHINTKYFLFFPRTTLVSVICKENPSSWQKQICGPVSIPDSCEIFFENTRFQPNHHHHILRYNLTSVLDPIEPLPIPLIPPKPLTISLNPQDYVTLLNTTHSNIMDTLQFTTPTLPSIAISLSSFALLVLLLLICRLVYVCASKRTG
ncbi:uncharacterized protein LOC143023068 [Oratosquilla oratoria]|uniref:uncharacterized protein LOC143023068 n=1 Tax=Oratosquilla oratoria TaxID=337810 RepID=UPI003F763248